MKKIWLILFTCVLAFALMCALSSCGEHTHSYTEKITPPTCTEKGYTTYTCECGDSYVGDETDFAYHILNGKGMNLEEKHPYETPGITEYEKDKAYCEKNGTGYFECDVCKKNLKVTTYSATHRYIVESIKEPSCTKEGYSTYSCKCGDSYKSDYTNSLKHSYTIISITEATCMKEGYILFTCSTCQSNKTQIIDATGHIFGKDNICDKCAYEANNHEHSLNEKVISPTCTSFGYTIYTCSCGYLIHTDYIEQKMHSWKSASVKKDKPCIADGLVTYECENCDTCFTEIIKASHNLSETIITEPTCATVGKISTECLYCDYKETKIIPITHSWKEKEVIREATCTEAGELIRECELCEKSENFEIEAPGHKFYAGYCRKCNIHFSENVTEYNDHPLYGMYFEVDEMLSAYASTPIDEYGIYLYFNEGAVIEKIAVYLTQDGTMWRRCIACVGSGITYAACIPYLSNDGKVIYSGINSDYINIFYLSESFDGIWCYSDYTTIGANLENKDKNFLLSIYDIVIMGQNTKLFNNLDEMKAWLKCYEHNYIQVVTPPTCTEQGYTTYRCACGKNYKDDYVNALGHSYLSDTTPPTCTKQGYTTYICTKCEKNYNSDYIEALDHSYGDWYTAEDATCSKKGLKRQDCERCEEFKTEIIKQLDHSYSIKMTPASCTERGYTTYSCECGHTRKSNYIKALGHNYLGGKCTRCNIIYIRVDNDTILFGEYPQSLVMNSEIIASLNSAAGTLPTENNAQSWTSYGYYIEGNGSNFMWYIDLKEGDEKYRGVYFTSYRTYTADDNTPSIICQDANGYKTNTVYWFRYDPISWSILFERNKTALILCDMIIDSQEYYSNLPSNTINETVIYSNNYEYSIIRAWLNETFIETAFTELQKEIILTTNVDNSASSTGYGSNYYTCSDTEDKIFLLSYKEIVMYLTSNSERYRKPSAYAQSQGAYASSPSSDKNNGNWWLRSPYYDDCDSANVICGNSFSNSNVQSVYYGIVPALRIRLDNSEEPYTRVDDDTILFGEYPQRLVEDSALIESLNSSAGALPTSLNSRIWVSYGYYISGGISNYMWYIDIEKGSEKYRGVYFTSYRPYNTDNISSASNSYQDDNGYKTGTVYWFLYEPISWSILSESDGTALILCDMIIDSQNYYPNSSSHTVNGATVYSNNYEYSTIRAWLNEIFYETAFNELQKEIILTTIVNNSLGSTGDNSNPHVCSDTEDKIFLLSYEELTTYLIASNERYRNVSAYAQSQGAWMFTSFSDSGTDYWWLRSPGYSSSDYVRGVHDYGNILCNIKNTSIGVVPALQIRL